MILTINVTGKDMMVTQTPRPKFDQHGEQRVNKQTDEPLWVTQVVVTDDDGGEVIGISTAGVRPEVEIGDMIVVSNLVAVPWNANGRSGVSYKADSIKVDD